MIAIRKSEARGYADHGWLKSFHSFSFANYYDPKHMGFRDLRVINEDRIEGGMGFGMHSHKDMEIISYVLSGALEHKDSHGNATIISPGEVQRMSAGTGVSHSEHNQSKTQLAHFFQIWILPKVANLSFGYAQKSFEQDLNSKKSVLVCSETGRDGSISIQQDVDLHISRLPSGETWSFELRDKRHAWLQVAKGNISLNGKSLGVGDGAAVSDEKLLKIEASSDCEILLFDLK